jgi:hypothetical protein
MSFEAILVAIMLAMGYLAGTQGLTIKPFIKTGQQAIVQYSTTVRYECPQHITQALMAGSHLNPQLFCKRIWRHAIGCF